MKKAVSEAAHNMIDLNEESLPTQDILNFLRIPGVIGKRAQEGFPYFPCSDLIPLRIWCRRGILSMLGSLPP